MGTATSAHDGNAAPARLVVLISGGGRSLANLLDAAERGASINASGRSSSVGNADGALGLRARIVGVISSKRRSDKNAAVLARCDASGIPVRVLRARDFDTPEAFSAEQDAVVDGWAPDVIVLAGYLTLWLIAERYRGRVLNIHPALLPKYAGRGFYGRRVHEAVLAAGDTVSGCTVHICDNEYDHGPIVLQREVPVLPDDDADTLAARVFEMEKRALVEAINVFVRKSPGLLADTRTTCQGPADLHPG